MSQDEKLDVKHYRKMFDPVQKSMVDVPVYEGDHMKAGAEITGPAIVELTTTTIIVPSEFHMKLDENGNFIMKDTGSEMKDSNHLFASTNNN